MGQEPDFKKNLWGYDRDSVHDYVTDVQRSEAALQDKVDSITRTRAELEYQIEEFRQRLQASQEDLNGEKGKNQKLNQMIRFLQEEIDRQRRVSDQQMKEFQQVRNEKTELANQVQEAEGRGKLYDEAASSIGSAIILAQQTASRIITDANTQVKELTSQADQMAEDILFDVRDMYQNFMDFRDDVNKTIEQLNTQFDDIEKRMLQTGENVLKFKKNLPEIPSDEEEAEEVEEETEAEPESEEEAPEEIETAVPSQETDDSFDALKKTLADF